jgi:hypothetical protein
MILKLGRWVVKVVAGLLATAALWVRHPDISQKYNIGNISKEVACTFQPAKKN